MSDTNTKSPDEKSYEEKFAEKIIAALQEGKAYFVKEWTGAELVAMRPINATTGKGYSGSNFGTLLTEQLDNGYDDPRWLTYKQAKAIGAQVRSGEQATKLKFYKFSEEVDKTDEKGNVIKGDDGKPEKVSIPYEFPKVSYFAVFNANQIDGMPPLARETRPEKPFEAIEAAERIIEKSGAIIRHREQNNAYYRPDTDEITLPIKAQFTSEMGYYSTALHELGHWTGHATRLNRDMSDKYGTEGYAREELRAEIASFMLCCELGVDFKPGNHHAYIQNWVSILEDKPTEIFKASADAGKITQFLQGFNTDRELVQRVQEPEKEIVAIRFDVDSVTKHFQYDPMTTPSMSIPKEAIEDAIMRYGLMEIKDDNNRLIELKINNTRYELSGDGTIHPRDYMDQRPFEKNAWEGSTVTVLVPQNDQDKMNQKEGDYHIDPAVLEVKRRTEFGRFDETDLALHVEKAPYNTHTFPIQNVEDAISRYGTIRTDEDMGTYKQIYAELVVGGEKYILSTDPSEVAKIQPRDKYSENLFDVLKSPQNITTLLTPTEIQEPKLQSPANVFDEKTFLSVAYSEKEVAKQYGAKWDKEEKLWYAPAGTERDKLERFVPENRETKALADSMAPADQKDVLAQFKAALESRGLIIDGDPIMDSGRMIRVPVEGDKRGELSGAYVGYSDGRPAGVIQNWREGTKTNWVAQGEFQSVSPEQAEAQRAKMAQNKADRENERKVEHLSVALKVRTDFKESREASNDHPYLVEKGVQSYGLKLDHRGNLLMPLLDIEDRIWTAQHIGINGYKSFEPGGKKEGNFYTIGEHHSSSKSLIVSEGYATAASIHEATGKGVIVAVDAYNLEAVGKVLRERYPDKEIFFAADNDIKRELVGKENVGRLRAEAAAEAVQGVVIYPQLTQSEIKAGMSDFNDIQMTRGKNELREQLTQLFNDGVSMKKIEHVTPKDEAFKDFQSVKDYIKELQAEYPKFTVMSGVSLRNDSLYSNYMMADKENNIKYLHITHDGRQEWSNIDVNAAKERLENAYKAYLIKDWELDQKSRGSAVNWIKEQVDINTTAQKQQNEIHFETDASSKVRKQR